MAANKSTKTGKTSTGAKKTTTAKKTNGTKSSGAKKSTTQSKKTATKNAPKVPIIIEKENQRAEISVIVSETNTLLSPPKIPQPTYKPIISTDIIKIFFL